MAQMAGGVVPVYADLTKPIGGMVDLLSIDRAIDMDTRASAKHAWV